MTIVNALKKFFLKLNGSTPSGNNIAEVIRNGADSVQLSNELSQADTVAGLATRVGTAENNITALQDEVIFRSNTAVSGTTIGERVSDLEMTAFRYRDYNVRTFYLRSYSPGDDRYNLSKKVFSIRVLDDGTLTATEVTMYTVSWTVEEGIDFKLASDGWYLSEESDPMFKANDTLMLFATPPVGRTLAPIIISGANHDPDILPDNPNGKVLVVTGNLSITLSLVPLSE